MRSSFVRDPKSKTVGLNGFCKRLEEIDDKVAEVGYFKESGFHEGADMHYAALAMIHANGHLFGFETRDVLAVIRPNPNNRRVMKFIKDQYKDFFNGDKTAQLALTAIARRWAEMANTVFGNPQYLPVTSNPTPLEDTEELRKNFGYKTSFDQQINYVEGGG